ncbi:MAG: hypothetical protein FJX72_03610, partial [Armatimonadetes bacterium]|nr:hypothetical protein [Armatimonadota bacterium]
MARIASRRRRSAVGGPHGSGSGGRGRAMRIRELQLIAFGRFTDVTLDFAADAGRLSIVYGPNEAGKSTALRAISALLFGIPGQTDDDYLHQYGAMRIGAVLARGDGAVGHFVRRKGNKDTLLDADGSPVIEDRVRDFLGGMDRERFMAAFALDHETLRMGGQELLEGRGDVGESLFAGATGIVGIRRLRQQLEEDAGKIWKPRAQSLPLAEAMKHLDEARKLRSGDTLSARQWKEVTDRVEGLERECTGLRERRAALESASRRIERRLAAMPKVRERALLLQERGELGDVILLPSGATSERERAERNKRDASDLIVEASDAIKGLRAKLEALSPPDAWLKAEGSIEGLNGPYGAYVKAMNDVPLRRAEADRSRREAAGRLRDVRPDLTLNDAESLRLSMQTRAKIESLADEGTRLSLECSTAREECRKAEGEATDLEARLTGMQAVADPSNLRACLQSEREHAADERELPGLQAKRKHEAEQIGVEQRRIGLAGRDLQEVDALPVPSAEAIEDLRSQLDAAGRRQDDAEKEVGRARADLAGTERDIEALRSAGEVPLEADLDEARGRREAGWRLVRASWLDACADPEAERAYDPDRPLAEAYEASVGHADVIADRLRREAERVARLASLTARKQGLQQQLEQAEREASDRSDELEEVRRKWVAAWAPSGIEPQSPSAMRAWLAGLNRLRQSIADVHDLDRDVALRREMVDLARAKLIEAVAAVVPKPSFGPNDSFSSIVAMSEGLVRALDDALP